ncbi:hypothetical protein SEUCBS140593_003377 [Sporothrix eucalyptigena]|uniref:Rhodopsin domain-containing protein n=1 Tax=Sporothrix eucalyptigena TaxID=1812306 RepID=A0ABP0BE85_9PEZI
MSSITAASVAGLPHDDYGPQLVILSLTLVLASALFLALRIILKINHRRGLWWDDYLLVASWVVLTAGVILNVIDVGYGYGRHSWDVSPTHIGNIVTNGTISGTLVLLAACWSKTSFAFTLLRLPIGWMRSLVWTIIITLNVAMHMSALSIWIECPFSTIAETDRICIPIPMAVEFGIVVGGYSAAVDFTLALLPWKFLWNLQMQRREKIGVLIAMSMGTFAGLSAVIKTTKLTTLESPDIIDSVQLAAWGTAEVGVTIMAASIPILRALFRPGSGNGVPNMNYGNDGATRPDMTNVTPAQRRGAAAAEAAATATTYPPQPTTSPAETKRWPLLTPKSVRFPSVYRSSSLNGAGSAYTNEDEFDDVDNLKKPAAARPSMRSFFKSPRSPV